jgi:multisubunit Na+/H+ antiporter MnhF subunit
MTTTLLFVNIFCVALCLAWLVYMERVVSPGHCPRHCLTLSIILLIVVLCLIFYDMLAMTDVFIGGSIAMWEAIP